MEIKTFHGTYSVTKVVKTQGTIKVLNFTKTKDTDKVRKKFINVPIAVWLWMNGTGVLIRDCLCCAKFFWPSIKIFLSFSRFQYQNFRTTSLVKVFGFQNFAHVL